MRQLFFLLTGLPLLFSGCSPVPQEKAITILNSAAVDADLLERIRAFAETELHVPVRVTEGCPLAGTCTAVYKKLLRIKKPHDAALIALAEMEGSGEHLAVFASEGIAMINVPALYTEDAIKYERRIERQVMRAAAFAFGLPPTPDPFCVTRDYRSLEDLDRMGRNFSPPWQGRFAEEAAGRGLAPLHRGGERR